MKNLLKILILFLLVSCKTETLELYNMLGQNVNSSIIQEYLKLQPEKPNISNYTKFIFYNYKESGISLSFNNENILKCIFLYSENADGFKKYSGKLPNDLSFELKRKDIEEKLGKPNKYNRGELFKYWSTWKKKGITIGYKEKDTLNMENKIHHIGLISPK